MIGPGGRTSHAPQQVDQVGVKRRWGRTLRQIKRGNTVLANETGKRREFKRSLRRTIIRTMAALRDAGTQGIFEMGHDENHR